MAGHWEAGPDGILGTDDDVWVSDAGGQTTTYREGPDGILYAINGTSATPVSGVGAKPTTPPTQPKNLGNDVYQDEYGTFIYTDSGMGTDAEGNPSYQKYYLTSAQAKSLLDPTAGGLSASEAGNLSLRGQELAENARQFDVTSAQNAAQSQADQMFRWGQLNQQIAEAAKADALAQQQFEFQKAQQVWAESQGKQQLALQAQGLAQDAANQRMQVSLHLADLKSQAQQFNAQMQFQTQQANVNAQEQKASRLQSLASDISEASKDPGDRAKLASYVLANSGYGQADKGIAQGANFVTPESLTGLEGLLRNRQQVQGQPDNPFTFTPLDTNFSIPQENVGAGGLGMAASNNGQIRSGLSAEQEAQLRAAGLNDQGIANIRGAGGLTPDAVTALQQNQPQTETQTMADQTLPKAAKGGVIRGAYMGDEQGQEIHIPLAAGLAIVIPHDKVKQMSPEKVKTLKKMAAGGLFDSGIFTGLDTNRDLSTAYQAEVNRRARAGTPFQQNLPTPVYGSSPGLPSVVVDLLNSLNASERGLPVTYSQQEQAKLAPVGLQTTGVVRRTR